SILLTRPPPSSTPFPYTTLFRSISAKSPSGRAPSPPNAIGLPNSSIQRASVSAGSPTVGGSISASRSRENGGASLTRYSAANTRSEEHTSELQSQSNLVCRLLLE